jgi:hypothetical protein
LNVSFLQALLKQADKEIAGEGHPSNGGENQSNSGENQTDDGRDADVMGQGGAAPSDGGVVASSVDLECAPTAKGDAPISPVAA